MPKLKKVKKSNKKAQDVLIYNDDGEIVPKKCPKCGSDVGIFLTKKPICKCRNKKCGKTFGYVENII